MLLATDLALAEAVEFAAGVVAVPCHCGSRNGDSRVCMGGLVVAGDLSSIWWWVARRYVEGHAIVAHAEPSGRA